jgi:glycosyltransferase involved in cell wall biosynthesis
MRLSHHLSIVHHWLVSYRGGEKVLKQFSELYPESKIFCLLARREAIQEIGLHSDVKESFLKYLPGAKRLYKTLLPLFPLFIASIKIPPETKVLLTSDASLIKGVKKPDNCVHFCFCHSPPRYLWELQSEYLKVSRVSLPVKILVRIFTPYLKAYDKEASKNVDHFIANSNFVAQRISKYYGRSSTVVYPPINADEFEIGIEKSDYFLVVSELVPYKRIDLAVRAFSELHKPLVIIGGGSELARLKREASSCVRFIGRQPFNVVREHYRDARALIFPGIEDFGLTPIEAQASGTPVIAFSKGGVTETVVDGQTGIFFHSQSCDHLERAVIRFCSKEQMDPYVCRRNAERFNEQTFKNKISDLINKYSDPL